MRTGAHGPVPLLVGGYLLHNILVDIIPVELHAQPRRLRDDDVALAVQRIAVGLEIGRHGVVVAVGVRSSRARRTHR